MSKAVRRRTFLKATVASLATGGAPVLPGPRNTGADALSEWRVYGSNQGASRYSPLSQINRDNVAKLKVAWVHHTEDASKRPATTIECTPIVVDGRMYITTARLQVRALDAATGEVLWNFNPHEGRRLRRSAGINRAVTYWAEGKDKRIFVPVRDQLFCLNATTGELVASFGAGGTINLSENFDHDMEGLSFKHTSPPVVFEDILIVGGGGGEGPYPEAPGHVRGYDVHTGKRRWIFHTVPHPGEFGYETWHKESYKRNGGTNNWAGMSIDTQRGIVFVSIGSPAFDFYGGDRKGANLFGNCLVALDAKTGERMWHYQTVHHDVWDYDLPAQPALLSVNYGDRTVDAVAQVTKQAMLFLFDRATGKPLFEIEERPIPASDVPGEELWKTQPFAVKPKPFSRQGFFEDWITDISPEARAAVKKELEGARMGDLFTPISLDGTVIHPGFRGGALWGGCSYDPETNLLYVNSDESTNLLKLRKRKPEEPFEYGLVTRKQLFDPEGYPVIKPPWGYITAIDLTTGQFAWRIVNGEHPELTARGIPKTGTLSHGGTICTGGGLLFMAGTLDAKIRAYDSSSGEVLWQHQLNAGGFATPATYEAGGRQYVVIAAGGGKTQSAPGDEFVAFALPEGT